MSEVTLDKKFEVELKNDKKNPHVEITGLNCPKV